MATTNKKIVGGLPDLVLSSAMTNVAPAAASDIVTTGTVTNYPTGATSRSFVLFIDSEAILISARSGNNFTVEQRGYDGTTAAAHEPGAPVQHALDAATIQAHEDHVVDTSAAHVASAIGSTAVGALSATNVQSALAELDADLTTEIAARAAGDTAVAALVTAEASARAGADSTEATTRGAADTALGLRVTTLEAQVELVARAAAATSTFTTAEVTYATANLTIPAGWATWDLEVTALVRTKEFGASADAVVAFRAKVAGGLVANGGAVNQTINASDNNYELPCPVIAYEEGRTDHGAVAVTLSAQITTGTTLLTAHNGIVLIARARRVT